MRGIFLVLILAFTPFFLNASHLTGGVIEYKTVSNNRIALTLKCYHDYEHADPAVTFGDSIAPINFFRADGTVYFHRNLIRRQIKFFECIESSDCEYCNVAIIYTDTFTLNIPTDGLKAVYNRCCRNEMISSMMFPSDESLEITAMIYPGTNSSPVFKDIPVTYFRENEGIYFNGKGMDEDGDSLSYKPMRLYSGTADISDPMPSVASLYVHEVLYKPGFDFPHLTGLNDTLSIDETSGVITAHPPQGYYQVAYEIREYRNQQLIGIYNREIQFFIMSNSCEYEVAHMHDSTFVDSTVILAPEANVDYIGVEPFSKVVTVAMDTLFSGNCEISVYSTKGERVFYSVKPVESA